MTTSPEALLDLRDPNCVRRLLPVVEAATRWFRPRVIGLERLPASGPYLMVGPHSGGIFMPDALALAAAWIRRHGPEAELYGLGYDLLLTAPVIGSALERLGMIPAAPANAEAALARGAAVLVYPGGDLEDCRPWRDRHQVDLGGHTGFVKLALRTGVPVVPVVAHGSHETDLILTRGDRVARTLHLGLLRVHVFPVVAGLPFGVAPIFVPHLPLPARVTVEVLDPLDWSSSGPDSPADARVVAARFQEIRAVLQRALDRLAATPALPLLDPPPRLKHADRAA